MTETDCAFLLRCLSDGRPHTLNELLQRSLTERGCGLTVHSRAADLRKQGYRITNRPGTRRRVSIEPGSPSAAPHECPRCGSDLWTWCDYRGCSICFEPEPEDDAVLGYCVHGVNLDRDFCKEGCRV